MAAATTTYFYSHNTGKERCLSNFWSAKFVHRQIAYTSSEQAFMHRKALFFGDCAAAERILKFDCNPAECKREGRKVTPFDAGKWLAAKVHIMRDILMDKFAQNPDLRDVLDGTGDTVLAEAAPRDREWGIGLTETDAKHGVAWRGNNLLGKTLMEVRKALRRAAANAGQPLHAQ